MNAQNFNMWDESRRVYHPHRDDGLDRNLRLLNRNDFLSGMRCTCPDCLLKYADSREYKKLRP
jgi:hypothetical protein